MVKKSLIHCIMKKNQCGDEKVVKKKKGKSDILIGGLDFDSWISKPSGALTGMPEDTTLKYGTKLVAFLDLLGISDQIIKKINGQETEIISKMNAIKDIVGFEIKNNAIDMLYISDSFIFVCPEKLLLSLLDILANIQMRILIECQTMLRGALEYGSVIVQDDGKQIIGPAYIEAYIRQEKHAIYPRIIIGNSVMNLINRQLEKCKDKIIVSKDRETSIDYVNIYRTLDRTTDKDVATRLKREGIFNYLCNGYEEFDKIGNSSIRAKYAWTINYLRDKGVWSNEGQHNHW